MDLVSPGHNPLSALRPDKSVGLFQALSGEQGTLQDIAGASYSIYYDWKDYKKTAVRSRFNQTPIYLPNDFFLMRLHTQPKG